MAESDSKSNPLPTPLPEGEGTSRPRIPGGDSPSGSEQKAPDSPLNAELRVESAEWREIQRLRPHSTSWPLGLILLTTAILVFSALGLFRRTPGVILWVIPIF